MKNDFSYPILSAELQVGFYFRLNTIKDLYFHDALSKTIQKLKISDIDNQLNNLVSNVSLQKLATVSIRGEALFPLPIILFENPFLLGYYRLLFGISQKEFYSKGPFGAFKSMEEKGKISKNQIENIPALCKSLIATGEALLQELGQFNIGSLAELQLLTVGPQFRGTKNNQLGQVATEKTFSIIKEFVSAYITSSTPTSIEIRNDSGRLVLISFAPDPDIVIVEKLESSDRGLISIEIKGGSDVSNIHNRIGEAEKSHQKAKKNGYREFMTIISVDISYDQLKIGSPTTSHFFHIDKINDRTSTEFKGFRELLSSILNIH